MTQRPSVQTRNVSEDEDGMRLDRWFKAHYASLPHSRLEKLLRTGQVRVDGARAKASTRLATGQNVRIPPLPDVAPPPAPKHALSKADRAFLKSITLYEDDDLLLLNKPSGIAVQGGTKTTQHIDRLLEGLGDSPDTRPIFTAEKKSLVIDWLVKWRIKEPRQFIRNNGTDFRNLENRLSPVVQAAFNEEITRRNVSGVLSVEREKVMRDVLTRLADDAQSFGIEVVDVRIKRVDFVADITDSVFKRMESERKRVANELRSQGQAEGEKIRADADRQREVIVAQAYSDAQKIKGEGDAKAAALYAESFGRDPAFARFYRSLEAYRASFRSRSDVMVVNPGSEFFRAMRGAGVEQPPKSK